MPEHFVDQFFGSQNVVEELKNKFGGKIAVDLVIKDNDNGTKTYHSNVASLKPYLKPIYTVEEVNQIVGLDH